MRVQQRLTEQKIIKTGDERLRGQLMKMTAAVEMKPEGQLANPSESLSNPLMKNTIYFLNIIILIHLKKMYAVSANSLVGSSSTHGAIAIRRPEFESWLTDLSRSDPIPPPPLSLSLSLSFVLSDTSLPV